MVDILGYMGENILWGFWKLSWLFLFIKVIKELYLLINLLQLV
jgi:hypothetical protein